jgi:hypothetical protein
MFEEAGVVDDEAVVAMQRKVGYDFVWARRQQTSVYLLAGRTQKLHDLSFSSRCAVRGYYVERSGFDSIGRL